jgi:hypothetical protein
MAENMAEALRFGLCSSTAKKFEAELTLIYFYTTGKLPLHPTPILVTGEEAATWQGISLNFWRTNARVRAIDIRNATDANIQLELRKLKFIPTRALGTPMDRTLQDDILITFFLTHPFIYVFDTSTTTIRPPRG